MGADYARARSGWPGVEVSEAAFARFVEARAAAAAELCWEDLYLACACAEGSPSALEAFDRRLMPAVAPVVARLDPSPAFADEVRQRLREKLFMGGAECRPKIHEYSGKGTLASWLRTVALRVALDAREAGGKVSAESGPGDDDALADVPAAGDLELDLIKARYRAEFKTAFQAAFRALSSRERNVLRLNLLDGLNIDQIGAMYGAHRATVARWIARARELLDGGTRERLAEQLKIPPGELDSLVGLVRSQLEVSLDRLLKG